MEFMKNTKIPMIGETDLDLTERGGRAKEKETAYRQSLRSTRGLNTIRFREV